MQISGFLILQSMCLMFVCWGIAKVYRFEKGLAATFKNSVVLSNSGNFGLPVSQLVFQQNPLGLSIQIVVTIFQNLLTCSYGLLNSVSVKQKGFQIVREFFKLPIMYAIILGFILNTMHISIPSFIWKPVENVLKEERCCSFWSFGLFTYIQ